MRFPKECPQLKGDRHRRCGVNSVDPGAGETVAVIVGGVFVELNCRTPGGDVFPAESVATRKRIDLRLLSRQLPEVDKRLRPNRIIAGERNGHIRLFQPAASVLE